MLEFLAIKNFKTFREAGFELGGLNLFAGLNGMGKSTVMQTLLMLRQSFDARVLQQGGLLLNGTLLELGTGVDVLADSAEDDVIGFTLHWSQGGISTFRFAYSAESDYLSQCNDLVPIEQLTTHSLFKNNFQYLSAERIGPKTSYPLSIYHVQSLNSLGQRGEYTAHYIAKRRTDPIGIPALRHPQTLSKHLGDNLEAWMSHISPGLRIGAQILSALNAASLSFQFVQGKDVTREFKPQNVGFGLTYVLPVVTALLAAKPGDLVMIENPESHIHPAGQVQLGRLCSIAAQHGVQLIIETHSDHFLNGVRVAARKDEIDASQVHIYFLERSTKGDIHDTDIDSPKLDQQGRLSHWPRGFFDEWDQQLRELL